MLPTTLRPTGETAVPLPGGTVYLPTCYPVFETWTGLPPFTYGGKPILAHNQQPVFAELLVAQLFQEERWNARWTETYGAPGGLCCLLSMPAGWKLGAHHVPMPVEQEALIRKIMHAGQTMGCFDVFAWTGQDLVFCEAKRHKRDRITAPQVKFIDGALKCGLSRQSLVIVEWSSPG